MTTLDTLQMLREELQTGYGHTACAVRNKLTGGFVPTRQVKLWTEWSRQIRHDKQFNAVCVCVCFITWLCWRAQFLTAGGLVGNLIQFPCYFIKELRRVFCINMRQNTQVLYVQLTK